MRHGESEGNCNKSVNRYTPNHRVCLTPDGHDQARQAGKVLRNFLSQFDAHGDDSNKNARSVMFYTSPYLRARETCQGIVNGIKDLENVSISINEEARMREQDFGNFQSTPEEMEDIWEQRAHYGHFFYRIPHGESAADVYDRIASFNETLFRQFQKDDFPNVLVLVTHGIWARVFLMKWFRWLYEKFEQLRNIPHCHYLVMKQGADHRYQLKTPLQTWEDLPDSDVDEELNREFKRMVEFNSERKLERPEDLDIASIIKTQKEVMAEQRKDRQLKHAYQELMDKFQKYSKYMCDQSVQNSDEEVANGRENGT